MAIALDIIKRELNITWECNPTENERLTAIEQRAEKILNDKAGRTLDFDTPSTEQQLLFDLCRYLRSDAYSQFLIDYSEELTELRLGGEENEAEQTT